MAATIKQVKACEILDSRGNPAVETTVILSDQSRGIASIPSGASVGKHEAVELRDNDPDRFNGMGVLKAITKVNEKIFPLIKSLQANKQEVIDQLLIDLDGTANKSRLGANSILSVSQALLKATAMSYKMPIYQYLKKKFKLTKNLEMPRPIFNLINAGKHGASELEFQEFQIIPWKQKSFKKNLQLGVEIYQALKKILKTKKLDFNVGDEGGFSPQLLNNFDALEILRKAIRKAGYRLGENVFLGLDVAASHFYKQKKYWISDFSRPISTDKLLLFYQRLVKQFHLRYLEDAFEEDSWQAWQKLTRQFSKQPVLITGDDLLCTNLKRLKKAIEIQAANAILVKPNQIGTINETIQVIKEAKKNNWQIIISHRSGETNDNFLADLAVGVGADMVKFGAPARGERLVKYNRLLKIEQEINK